MWNTSAGCWLSAAARRVGARPARGHCHAAGRIAQAAGQFERRRFSSRPCAQGHLDQLAVWQLEGTWKPAVLAEWAGNQKDKILAGEPINWKALPQQLPQRVVLTLGHDDLFPYRMEYLRELRRRKSSDERSMAGTIATLEFFEVRLGGQIPPQRFVFQPGNRTVVDGTDAYLKQLGITDAPPAAGSALESGRRRTAVGARSRPAAARAACAVLRLICDRFARPRGMA